MLTKTDRPTCVTVIGWFWIVVGGLTVLSGIMGLVVMPLVLSRMRQTPFPSGVEIPWVFRHLISLSLLQLVVAAVLITAGIQLLRLRPWARTVLEIAAWLSLAYILGLGAFMGINIWGFPAVGMPTQEKVIASVMGTIVIALYSGTFGLIIRFLRSRRVREAMRTGGAGDSAMSAD